MCQLHIWSKLDQMQTGLSKHVNPLLDAVLLNARSLVLLNVEHTSLPCLGIVLHALTCGLKIPDVVPV